VRRCRWRPFLNPLSDCSLLRSYPPSPSPRTLTQSRDPKFLGPEMSFSDTGLRRRPACCDAGRLCARGQALECRMDARRVARTGVAPRVCSSVSALVSTALVRRYYLNRRVNGDRSLFIVSPIHITIRMAIRAPIRTANTVRRYGVITRTQPRLCNGSCCAGPTIMIKRLCSGGEGDSEQHVL
jgi:hypothetical protein